MSMHTKPSAGDVDGSVEEEPMARGDEQYATVVILPGPGCDHGPEVRRVKIVPPTTKHSGPVRATTKEFRGGYDGMSWGGDDWRLPEDSFLAPTAEA
jgi:hypothetical protein